MEIAESIFEIKDKLFKQLERLISSYKIIGIKGEFEAEGSSFNDLVFLRYLTAKAGTQLHVKIGGVEAVYDIKNCFELNVDGIIAPMVESKFGAYKFIEAVKKIYGSLYRNLHVAINMESKTSINNSDEIIDFVNNKIHAITIGRSDLSGSFFSEDIEPDSDFILDTIKKIGEKTQDLNLNLTVGGSLSVQTKDKYESKTSLSMNISRFETRKVIFPRESFFKYKDLMKEVLYFERLYILHKKKLQDLFLKDEMGRLTNLARRSY